jgi:hypothetical protein
MVESAKGQAGSGVEGIGDLFPSPAPGIRKGASISDCGQYRWLLWREWSRPDHMARPLSFVMLNPSTADAALDDPTIRRCVRFARDRGFTGVRVVNLFAYRSTIPTALRTAVDPIGHKNDFHLRSLFGVARANHTPVIAAWGVHGALNGRDEEVLRLARECEITLSCLGTTKDGAPRHPLYVRADQPFVSFHSSTKPTPEGGERGTARGQEIQPASEGVEP